MTSYSLRRIASLLPLLLCLSAFSFALGQVAPGNRAFAAFVLREGRPPTPGELRAMEEELGLDQPAIVQYGRWLGDTLGGDLGVSSKTGQSVAASLRHALPVTVQLGLLAALIVVVLGFPLGVLAALTQGRAPDHLSRVFSLLGVSLPSFWVGYLLMITFSVRLHVLPTTGIASPSSYVLPAATLALYATAVLVRLTRASMLEVLGEEFIRGAQARGIPQARIVTRHAARVALNPVATYGGLVLGGLLGGAVVVETVFAVPGIGKLVVDAINERDFPVVQGFVLLFGTIVLLVNLAVDLLYGILDPRARMDPADGHPARAY